MSFLKISSQLNVQERTVSNVMQIKNFKITEGVGKLAVYVIKELSPVGMTGELRRSVRIIESSKRQSGGEYKGFIRVGPTASYARFIIRGTRYITPNNFVRRAKPVIIAETNRLVQMHYGRGKFRLAKYFSLGQ